MTLSDSVAWHREQAAFAAAFVSRVRERGFDELDTASTIAAAAHHTRAADLMAALAVPGVAELLTSLSSDDGMARAHSAEWMDDKQRAALSTLAKIGSGR